MNAKWILNLVLIGVFAGAAHAQNFSRKTIQLTAQTEIGGILVEPGQVEIFQPDGSLAHGVLAKDAQIQLVNLPAGSDALLESPGHLAFVKLPNSGPQFLFKDVPFAGNGEISFAYEQYDVVMQGAIAYRPDQYPGFTIPELNPEILSNPVAATCTMYPDSSNVEWYCRYEAVLKNPIDQYFGNRKATIPANTTTHFGSYGMDRLILDHDQMFLGLPVSAGSPIRINKWKPGGPSVVVGLTLSQDYEYKNVRISAMQEVQFYEPDVNGDLVFQSFAPAGQLTVPAAGGTLELKALKRVVLNPDGSLHYGYLAFPQVIQGIKFPAEALVFFGPQNGDIIYSVGLKPGTYATVDGVKYGADFGTQTFFLDFDGNGHVVRAR